ncbi:MAG: TonB-dependent receptor, partial [Halieaceae bacterium]|nr:TonB-dependent receptor [Halieaceae bacterium]
IPLRATGFCNVNQLFDANTEQASRIEVIRGPGTASHGANALHGVINVVSQAPANERESSLSLEAGPDSYGRLKLDYSNAVGNNAYRLSVNGAHDGGFKDDSGYDQQKLSYRHDYQGNDWLVENLLTVTNLNQETAGFIEGEEAYKDNDRVEDNDNPEAFRDSKSARFHSRFKWNPSNSSSLNLTPYLRYTEMDFLMHFLPGQPLEENGQKSAGMQMTYFRQASVNTDWQAGLDAEYTSAYLRQTQFNEAAQSFLRPFLPVGKQYDYEVDSIMAAAFVNGNWQVAPNTRLSGGVRLDYVEYDYDNRMIDGNTKDDGTPCEIPCRYTRPADRSDDFNNYTVQLGIMRDMSDQLTLAFNFAHGFRPPQATELYRLQNGQTVADIDSEELDSFEVELRGSYSQVGFSVGAFLMKKDDVIFQDADRQNVSGAKTRHYGIEYSLRWQLLNQLRIELDGTYAHHQYDNNATPRGVNAGDNIEGNDIDTAPRHMSSVRLAWDMASNSHAELEWTHLGKYYLEPANGHTYDGHDLLHLRLNHRFSPHLTAGLRVTNLTDENYADRADFAFGDYRYFVGQPRSVFADISINF